ncbi:MAG: RNA polymerase subunit sigma [Planctomycetaceae bacterium]
MSGPIVRTGTNPKFWTNWDNVFGDKKGKSTPAADDAKTTAKKAEPKKSATKKVAPKKAADKSAKK